MPAIDLTVGQEWTAVREYCGSPTLAVLTDVTICQMYVGVFDLMAAQMQLSDRPLLRQIADGFTTTDWDAEVTGIERNAIINAVERRPFSSTDADAWRPLPIANIEDLSLDIQRGQPAVAIYDTPARIQFSHDPADWEYRFIYIRTLDRPTVPEAPADLNTVFSTLRIALTAQKALPHCRKNDKTTYDLQTYGAFENVINATIEQWSPAWTDWVNKEPQRGPMQRTRFNAGRGPHRHSSGRVTREPF